VVKNLLKTIASLVKQGVASQEKRRVVTIFMGSSRRALRRLMMTFLEEIKPIPDNSERKPLASMIKQSLRHILDRSVTILFY
jgi:hypothetical protein